MEVFVNGESKQVNAAVSLEGLLRSLELKPDRVAVELNRQIVRREAWPSTVIRDQDRLEIVQFVGGG